MATWVIPLWDWSRSVDLDGPVSHSEYAPKIVLGQFCSNILLTSSLEESSLSLGLGDAKAAAAGLGEVGATIKTSGDLE